MSIINKDKIRAIKIHKALPKAVPRFAEIIVSKGHRCFLVGGAVRNIIANLPQGDYDFATDATPEQIMNIFHRVIPTGIEHGTVTVLMMGFSFEITTFRVDNTYSDKRRPDAVTFSSNIYEDLQRRDFTINSIAYDVIQQQIIDPHKGILDIKQKCIRAIGSPEQRFNEDGLRLVRACRFAAQLEFYIDDDTLQGIKDRKSNILSVSAERIKDEFEKILAANKPSIGLIYMEETGLLSLIIPELAACKGVEQKGFHDFDVFYHSLYSCDHSPRDHLTVRLASLLHDIGKKTTIDYKDCSVNSKDVKETESHSIPIFYGHEQESAKQAQKILKRLRFPKQIEKEVVHLIRHHMFGYTDQWSDAAVRRLISKVGKNYINDLISLRRADCNGMSLQPAHESANLKAFVKRVNTILQKDENIFTAKELAVNGNELHQQADIPKGPEMGIVIDHLLETVIDDPKQNNSEQLIKIAKYFYSTYLDAQK